MAALCSAVLRSQLSSRHNFTRGGVQGQDNASGFVDKFVWITALTDSPDPFSASAKGTCVVKTAYRVRVHPGDTSDGKSPQTTFTRWLRQSVTITNQPGQVVRKLETVKQLPEPAGKATGLETQDMDIATGWDGRTQAGGMAPDGPYKYAVVGTYFRRAETPGTVQEHVFGITSQKTGDITLDNTPPTISAAQDPAANAAGWNNTDVKVTFSAQDNLSGIAELTQPVTVTAEGKDTEVQGKAVDKAGNEATLVYKVSIDKTPPLLTASQEPAANEKGWNNTDVIVTFEAEDKLSGVAEVTQPVTVTTEGGDIEVPGSATDRAGNTSYMMHLVSIDKTPPTTAVSRQPPANSAGWNNTDVELTFQATDGLSGVAHTYVKVDDAEAVDETGVTLSAEGEHTVAYWSVDEAGNAETEKTVSVNIDKTAPKQITVADVAFDPADSARVEDGKIVTEKSAITFRAPIDADVVQAIAFADNPALTVTAVIESVRVDVSGLSPGDYVVTVRLIDKADNKSDSPLPVKNVAQTGPVDTDGDGIPDEVEIAWGLDPFNPSDANLDPDGDCLTNLQEYRDTHTDPNNPDTDGDGMKDGCDEYNHGLDPLDPTGVNGPDGDLDEDGWTNAFELEIGTQPNDAGSGLAVTGSVFVYVYYVFENGVGKNVATLEERFSDGTSEYRVAMTECASLKMPLPYAVESWYGHSIGYDFPTPATIPAGTFLDIAGDCLWNGVKVGFCSGIIGGWPNSWFSMDPGPDKRFASILNKARELMLPMGAPANITVEKVEPPSAVQVEIPAKPIESAMYDLHCEPLLTDVDMTIDGTCTFGTSHKQNAPNYAVDVQPGTTITVTVRLPWSDGYVGWDKNDPKATVKREVTLWWPFERYSSETPSTQELPGNQPFIWKLKRDTSRALPQGAKIEAFCKSIKIGDTQYDNLKTVSFLWTEEEGSAYTQEITVKAEAIAKQTEVTTLVSVAIANPTGDPTKDPPYPPGAAEDKNEFTFDASKDGLCYIMCLASLSPDNKEISDWADKNLAWDITPGVQGSELKYGKKQDGVFTETKTSGIGRQLWMRFKGLPVSNDSFGKKTVTLSVGGSFLLTTPVEIFFSKDAKNHPKQVPAGVELADKVTLAPGSKAIELEDLPNWFYYWSQTVQGLIHGQPAPKIVLVSDNVRQGYYKDGEQYIAIDLDSGDGPLGTDDAPYSLHTPLRGIDAFAWLVAHESQHYVDYLEFWPDGYKPLDDLDGDKLPDKKEDRMGPVWYDSSTPRTYVETDDNDRVDRLNKDVIGDHTKDWAKPGYQHGDKNNAND